MISEKNSSICQFFHRNCFIWVTLNFFASPHGQIFWPEKKCQSLQILTFIASSFLHDLPRHTRNQILGSTTIDDHNKEGRWGKSIHHWSCCLDGYPHAYLSLYKWQEKSIFLPLEKSICWITSRNATYHMDVWTRVFGNKTNWKRSLKFEPVLDGY
jgi:hypothetical protein